MFNILEMLGIAVSVLGALFACIAWAMKYIVKPTIQLYKTHGTLLTTVNDIKKELTTNGGTSIKDTVNRIDRRQVIIDKRSKAIFYNCEDIILEVDESGNVLWTNEKFNNLMDNKNKTGLDWVSYIDEPDREPFLKEFKSCSENNRELNFETRSVENKEIVFSGYPYRDNNKNYGFLIFLKQEK